MIKEANSKPIKKKCNEFEDPLLLKIGKEVSQVRKLLDLTQSVFAEAIGITSQTLSLIENGKFKITNNLASKLYFSLYEITNDLNACNIIGITDVHILAINNLMDDLKKYILEINKNLKSRLIDK